MAIVDLCLIPMVSPIEKQRTTEGREDLNLRPQKLDTGVKTGMEGQWTQPRAIR